MFKPTKSVIAMAAAGVVLTAGMGTAEARKHWREVGACYPAIEGVATGTGILGLGSAKARIAARADWEAKANQQYGPRYSSLYRARNVQWDCKKGAILLAKCVVTAQPCSARTRG